MNVRTVSFEYINRLWNVFYCNQCYFCVVHTPSTVEFKFPLKRFALINSIFFINCLGRKQEFGHSVGNCSLVVQLFILYCFSILKYDFIQIKLFFT